MASEFVYLDGVGREEISIEDEYIYDDYDTEPLLTSQMGSEVMRRFQGKKYSLVMRDGTEPNTIIPMRYRIRRYLTRLMVMLFLCGSGVLAGYFISKARFDACKKALISDRGLQSIQVRYVDKISSESIEKFSRYFTEFPHSGGSNISYVQAQFMEKEWKKYGLDKVELKKYDVLLSYPVRPGIASIVAENGSTLFTAQRKEKILEQAEDKPEVLPPFNAFSSSGNVKGRLVFVNYATMDDTLRLRDMNISLEGHIAIAKYGRIFRGDKARIAAEAGAIGLILYTDPTDYSPAGTNDTYPKSWWLPPSGVQTGTLLNFEEGDPLTPGYPARDGIYRRPVNQANLPTIPVYPVSYGDAYNFLKLLTSEKAPQEWQGGLDMTYYIKMAEAEKRNVTLDVEMKLETKAVYNVIGTIVGDVEPDRLVLLGNHRDAWTFGAADPSSGTAVLMEVAKRLGEMKAKGWRPRRSIVLCSWGAKEHGLIGSTEWAEDFANLLFGRAVAYLNVDVAVEGNFSMLVQSSPLLDFAFMEASKKIQQPEANESIYDDWTKKFPDKENSNLPLVKKMGSGSDHTCAYFRLGVPSIYFHFTYDRNKLSVSTYPVYHTVHDSFHWMKNFVDRNFEYHRAMGQLWLQIGLSLAERVLLPFNSTRYAERLTYYAKDIQEKYDGTLAKQSISLENFMSAINNFTDAASKFQAFLQSVDRKSPLAMRMANDRLMELERAFINPQGLPGRPFMRHVVFAPSAHNAYAGSSFPSVVDALFEAQHSKEKDWDQVKKQLSVVVFHIQAAINVMSLEFI